MIPEDVKKEIFIGIYTGSYNQFNLPFTLYNDTIQTIYGSVETGFGLTIDKAVMGTDTWNLLRQFQNNIKVFSGAKTFQQISDSLNFTLDANGKLRPFNDYLKDVQAIDAVYNKVWLDVERDMAIKQAQSARYWEDIMTQADDLPYLQFKTVGDERVRPEHAELDGIIKRWDDAFWDTFMPPLDWNCRCEVIQLERGEMTEISKDKLKEYHDSVDPLFRMNPYKDGYIFKTEGIGSHPYMKVGEAFEVWKKANFGLPL